MRSVLITGGAGFIGVNAACRFARAGWKVAVLDDLSRKGSGENLESRLDARTPSSTSPDRWR
jgi:CDP-paratose 2-epimerase